MSNAAIFLCAGSGTRMRGSVHDKVLAPLRGHPVIIHSLKAFQEAGIIDQLTIVYRDAEQRAELTALLETYNTTGYGVTWVVGGKERQDSVFNALSELSLLVEYVFIHDCARPLIHPDALRDLCKAVENDKAAVLAHRVVDTIKKTSSKRTLTRRVLKDVPRAGLWAMETPQAFEREMIVEAYRRLRLDNLSVTDDTAAVSHQGHRITLVENSHPNPKLTVPADLEYLDFLLARRKKENS